MATIKKLKEWLLQPCKETEISTLDGAFYLPIGVVREKLEYMRSHFGATVHLFDATHQYHRLPNDTACSGNIQLRVIKSDEGIDIIVSGAATILLSMYQDNHHFAETVKSLATVNACKELGPQFGSHLNVMMDVEVQKTVRQKPVADELIKARYKQAVKDFDNHTIIAITENYVGYKED